MEHYNPYALGDVRPIGVNTSKAVVWEVVKANPVVLTWLRLNCYAYGEHKAHGDNKVLKGWTYTGGTR